MDRALLVQGDSAVKVACCGKQVHSSLSVVTLVRVVYLCLGEQQHLSPKSIPFDLRSIGLEKGLLASRRTSERGKVENLDTGRGTLGGHEAYSDHNKNVDALFSQQQTQQVKGSALGSARPGMHPRPSVYPRHLCSIHLGGTPGPQR